MRQRQVPASASSYDDMLRLSTDFARVLAPGRLRCLDYGTGTGAALPGLLNHFDEDRKSVV